ncbi:MAG: AraC family transcriptional regulator [Myxococcota bacterium]
MSSEGAAYRVSGSWTRTIMSTLENVGIDGAQVCARAGLDHSVMSDSTARIPRPDLARFWSAAAELSDDPLFGLHAGEKTLSPPNHIMVSLMVSAKTLGDGVNLVERFSNIIADGPWYGIEHQGLDTWLLFPGLDEGLLAPHHSEFIMATGQRIFTMMDSEFTAKEVRFAHPFRGRLEEYQRIFHCPVVFDSDCTAFVLSDETWNTPLPNWDPVWMSRLESFAAVLAERLEAPGFVSAVRHVTMNLLPRGECEMATVAKKLGTSERTLQRRLQEEGTSFRELVDSVRRFIVKKSRREGLSEEQIAARAGFSGLRALRRATQRWEEPSPSNE